MRLFPTTMDLKYGLQFVITLIVASTQVKSQNISNATTENPSEINGTVPDLANIDTYDYIVELLFYVNEEKIPEYVVKLIYLNSSENNITVKDVLSLFRMNNVTLPQTEDILQALSIQQSSVLSLQGMDSFMRELNVSFQDLYNSILMTRLKVSGLPLKNFLIALGIDNSQFTEGMAYGEPDPYGVFKKGNFSRASLENALKIVNLTTNELFDACRDEMFAKVVNLNTKSATDILEKYNFNSTRAIELWTYLNITINQLQDIQVFNDSLNRLRNAQNKKKFLGIVTNDTHIATNKIVYDTWQQKSFSKMYAKLVTGTDTQEVEGFSSTITNKIISLSLGGPLNTSLPILETSLDDVGDCIFVTSINGSLLLEAVEEVVMEEGYIDVRLQLNRTNVVLGSPLICRGKVYGLAAQLVYPNHVMFDSFYRESSSADVSSAPGLIFNVVVISVSLFCSRSIF